MITIWLNNAFTQTGSYGLEQRKYDYKRSPEVGSAYKFPG